MSPANTLIAALWHTRNQKFWVNCLDAWPVKIVRWCYKRCLSILSFGVFVREIHDWWTFLCLKTLQSLSIQKHLWLTTQSVVHCLLLCSPCVLCCLQSSRQTELLLALGASDPLAYLRLLPCFPDLSYRGWSLVILFSSLNLYLLPAYPWPLTLPYGRYSTLLKFHTLSIIVLFLLFVF